MSTRKVSSDTRRTILAAASRLVLSAGVVNLTLEAVAREAGVSKGGLLYHFPSKDALVESMIDYLVGCLSADIDREAGQDQDSPGRWLRAYVQATFSRDPRTSDMSAGVLVAIASNPELLDPLRARYGEWQRQAERDGIDPAMATMVRLAADGLWVAEMLGLAPPADPLRAQVLEQLLALTKAKTP